MTTQATENKVRRWRGKSGNVWVEVQRTESYVVLVLSTYYNAACSTRGRMTIPVKLLVRQFDEVT